MECENNKYKLHDGHRSRLRSRFLSEGLSSFEPHNVLELLLFYAIPRVDTNELAHQLINDFGSFSAVLDAPPEELTKYAHISENAAVLLRLIPDLSAYYRADKLRNTTEIRNYNALLEYMRSYFLPLSHETIILVMLDNRGRIIKTEKLAEGSVNSSGISPRLIAECAFRHNAAELVLAHNHPDGSATPSERDVQTTKLLIRSLEGVGLTLREHIVVSGNDCYPIIRSMREKALASLNLPSADMR